MTSTGISCSICLELYKSSDEIHSSNCGHVFHEHCLREWRLKLLNCPVCSSRIEVDHKICLSFEEGSCDYEKKLLELKSQLEKSLLNASDLQKELDDGKQDFLNIQKEFSEYEERMEELNESQVKIIESKTTEIHRLQETINVSSLEGSSSILQEEINILKEKNQHLSLKLTKEIRNSTELAVDKMKLQSMMEHAKKSLKIANEQIENNSIQRSKSSTGKVVYIPMDQEAENKGCPQSVIIHNVSGGFFDESSVLNYIGNLVRLMRINLNISDVQQISVLEGKHCKPLSIVLKFKTMSSKVMFLKKSNILKMYKNTKDLILHEFVDENINSLFHHAKILRGLGYKYVYCRNNKVVVRKDDISETININKIEDIEELKKNARLTSPLE